MDRFRAHHIICTSLYEGKGYSGAFCDNMTKVVDDLRNNPDREFILSAQPDVICRDCPNKTDNNECSHNSNRVVKKDRRVIEKFKLQEGKVYSYREMCINARDNMDREYFEENCGKCDWHKQGLCSYEDLISSLDRTINIGQNN